MMSTDEVGWLDTVLCRNYLSLISRRPLLMLSKQARSHSFALVRCEVSLSRHLSHKSSVISLFLEYLP